jgi:hypothetical protein
MEHPIPVGEEVVEIEAEGPDLTVDCSIVAAPHPSELGWGAHSEGPIERDGQGDVTVGGHQVSE